MYVKYMPENHRNTIPYCATVVPVCMEGNLCTKFWAAKYCIENKDMIVEKSTLWGRCPKVD